MYDIKLNVLDNGSESVPYNCPDYPVYAGSGRLSRLLEMGVVNHWHWDYEFACVTHGRMSYSINHDTVTLNAGEGIFINSGQIHRNFSMDGTDGAYWCVLFHPSLLRTVNLPTERRLGDIPYMLLRPEAPWQSALLDDAAALSQHIHSGVEQNIFAILSRVFSIAHALSEHMPDLPEAASDVRDVGVMREMIGYIQTHYRSAVRVQDVSRAGMVSASTCHALFRKFFGASPMHYLTEYRLEKSAELLRNPAIPVSDVADMTGFASPSYFSKRFKEQYSITPTEYRRLHSRQAVAQALENAAQLRYNRLSESASRRNDP